MGKKYCHLLCSFLGFIFIYAHTLHSQTFKCDRPVCIPSQHDMNTIKDHIKIKSNWQAINEIADRYPAVSPKLIAYVLHHEVTDNDGKPLKRLADQYQNSQASSVEETSKLQNKNNILYLRKIYIKNKFTIKHLKKKPKARNGKNGKFFATIGLGQIGLFTAFTILEEKKLNNCDLTEQFKTEEEGIWDLNMLSKSLTQEHINIEFLAAYLQWAFEVYEEVACFDLCNHFDMSLELHTRGYFEYYAQNRESKCNNCP